MSGQQWGNPCAIAALTAILSIAYTLVAEPLEDDEATGSIPRVSVVVARDRAKLLHDVYAATLHVMHDHYFNDERATVPARALEDAFASMADESNIKARWISVNTKPMSIRHEP